MNVPNPIGGRHKLAAWLNKLRAAILATRIKSVTGGHLIPSTDGYTLVIERKS